MKNSVFIFLISFVLTFLILIFLSFSITKYLEFKDQSKIKQSISQEKLKTESSLKILFLGDIMMDRSIRRRAESLGYDFYFQCVADNTSKYNFSNYDFVIVNLEGPVTNFESSNRGQLPVGDPESFRFTMSPEAIFAMRKAGINVLGVANNHIFDFGEEGIKQTKENIIDAGLYYFGDPIDENHRRLTLQKKSIKFHLVPFNEFFGSVEETLEDIKTIRDNNFDKIEPIIIFAHWGDEYVEPPERVKAWAKQFVDAGADAIIGHHPHVLQKLQYQNESPVFYSLGNFIFDQYFSEEVKNGGAAEIVINNRGEIKSSLLPVYLDSERRPCIDF